MFGCFFMFRRMIRITDAVIAVLCAVVMGAVTIGNVLLPDEIICYGGSVPQLAGGFSCSDSGTKSVEYQHNTTAGETLRVFNAVPVKQVRVTTKQPTAVYVSGEAFGIKLYTNGVMVVGTQGVDTGDGNKVNPAEEAGIKTGDTIVAINRINVFSSNEVTAILNDNNGEAYSVKIKRDGRYRTFTLTPAYSPREGCYKAGMWVRDSTAGIGTLTFYNPENGTFASLGHRINDVDTNEAVPLLEGEAVSANVTKVQKGSNGVTGSLWCDFEEGN